MAESPIMREVTLTLPMVADMEVAASKTATAMAAAMAMSSDKIDEVRMAVLEACINSFEHSGAEDRVVHITLSVLGNTEPEKLRIAIRDTGVGFRPEEVEEPRIEEKIKARRKRGWGLKIIKGLMDEVEIRSDESGTTIVMSKYRDKRGE